MILLHEMEAYMENNIDDAIAEFSEKINSNPKDANAYLERGKVYSQKGDYDKSIADCSVAIQINSNNDGAYVLRGVMYKKKGDFNKAIADISQAIKINPNNLFNYTLRGAINMLNNDYDEAIADFSRAIQLEPKYGDAYGNRSIAYKKKGFYLKALVDSFKKSKYYMNAGYPKLGDVDW